MKFANVVSAVAVAAAALGTMGATASAAPSSDVGALVWRVVAGPWPGNGDGLSACQRAGVDYRLDYDVPVGCLLEADSNQYFLWANH
ncbi:hypothetical protein [Lentzea sp. NPDC003310]|uniref:hypothetical protein n=1 Tax=Lentzea sp. NPDC003310 TaxID=3154447 RepID=UPI0033A6BA6F